MESLQLEVMAEERRQQLMLTMRQVRLEAEATASRAGLYAQAMLALSQWMIVFGERLRRRYDRAWAETHPVQRHLSMGQR
jgi:hypothetical protein